MIKRVISFLFVIVLCLGIYDVNVYADYVYVDFSDGGIHEINSGNSTEQFETVRVDYGYPGVETTLNVVTGGKITEGLCVFENGRMNLFGGEIGYGLFVFNDSRAVVYGGTIGEYLCSFSNSWVTVLGGVVGGEVDAFDNSRIDISDGIFNYVRSDGYGQLNISGGIFNNELKATQDSIMTIYGTDFAVDGISVGYGPITTASGVLTGTLANGDLINSNFYIVENADIILIPEPTTVLLLGFGGISLILRKRSRG